MGKIFYPDFEEFLDALNKCNVEYVLVGGFAVIYHGYERTTGDIDIWVNNTVENYRKIEKAFGIFRMPTFDMTLENFLDLTRFDVFKFGKSPVRIDILTACKGLNFDEAYANSTRLLFDGVEVNMVDLKDLIKAKKAAGRHKDLDDIEQIS